MTKRTVILDVDTGHDDAVAIMMAGRSSTLRLDAITVTAGNQTLAKTLRNTLNVCSALSLKVPVYPGMRGPLLRPLEPAPLIHGESGLDGPKFPECTLESRKEHAAVFLARRIMKAPAGTITVVATGPLSNIAMALLLEPSIAKRMRELVIMGGAVGWGNITPAAEYNSYADPEAARIVYASGASITLIPLDVTRTVTLTKERLAHLSRIPGKGAELFTASMTCYSAACAKYIGESASMHDPCCIAWLEKPVRYPVYVLALTIAAGINLVLGGRFYGHYALNLLPFMAMWAGFGLYVLGNRIARQSGQRAWTYPLLSLPVIGVTLFLVLSNYFPVDQTTMIRRIYGKNPFEEMYNLGIYVNGIKGPGDQVLIVGSEPQGYLYTKTLAPTRHVFPAFISNDDPENVRYQEEAIEAMKSSKPKYLFLVVNSFSWLFKDESQAGRNYFNNAFYYVQQGYRKVAIAETYPDRPSRYIYGQEATNHEPQSSTYIEVYERR